MQASADDQQQQIAQIMAEATAAGHARRDVLSAQPGDGAAIGALVVLPARTTTGNTPPGAA
jgi:hypothetical protein